MRRLGVIGVITFLVWALLAPLGTDAALSWQLLSTHPDAAAQPSARGKTIHELHGFAGRLYVGYGDYGDNTGPIAHRPWNPATQQFEFEAYQDTEEVNNYQTFSGLLWSPSIDPACCGAPLELPPNASDYAMLDGNRQWPDYDKFQSWHVFDFRNMGSAMIASGSADGCNVSCATVWRSDNGGADWYQWFYDTTDGTNQFGGHRCYDLATYGNRAWANCTTGHKTFNGSSWVADSQQYAHKESVVFNNTLVTPARNNLIAFNGSERILRSGFHRFAAVDGNKYYAVDGSGNVVSTSDLTSWTLEGTIPTSATAFTALNGNLYYGTANSTIYVAQAGTTTPTSSISTTTTAPTTTTTKKQCGWIDRLIGACR